MRLEVQDPGGKKLLVVTEVLRIERNPGHPLAALQLLGATDEWQGLIWGPAGVRVNTPVERSGDNEEFD